MQPLLKKYFLYALLVAVFLIMSYSYITYRESSQDLILTSQVEKKEVVVYKEKDVIKLLDILLDKKENKKDQLKNLSITSMIEDRNDKQGSLKHDYLKKYPEFLNCRKENLPKWSSASVVQTNMGSYNNLAPQNTHEADYLRGL